MCLAVCPFFLGHLIQLPGSVYRLPFFLGHLIQLTCTFLPALSGCLEFTFASQTKCYPAPGSCGSCTYVFQDAIAGPPGTKDFGGIYCGHHNTFYSDREVREVDLPTGFRFKCDHPDNLHFGLRSRNNRDWNQQTWRDSTSWPINIECQGSNIVTWDGGQSTFSTNTDVIMWIKADRTVEFWSGGSLKTTSTAIASNLFPIDMVISPPNNNHHGYLRNLGYVSDASGSCSAGIAASLQPSNKPHPYTYTQILAPRVNSLTMRIHIHTHTLILR